MQSSNITWDASKYSKEQRAHKVGQSGKIIWFTGLSGSGKSTLLNYFVGSKLSITSRKAQTTRYQLVGIFTDKDTQYIFVDTPGYQLKHLNQMNKSLNKSVNQALKDVDLILFLSEPNELDATDKKILQMIPNSTPILLIINKIFASLF